MSPKQTRRTAALVAAAPRRCNAACALPRRRARSRSAASAQTGGARVRAGPCRPRAPTSRGTRQAHLEGVDLHGNLADRHVEVPRVAVASLADDTRTRPDAPQHRVAARRCGSQTPLPELLTRGVRT